MSIRIEELGHVTLFVRDLEASARFYRDVLGLIDRGRGKNGRIAFFSAGRTDHHWHDLACQVVGPDAPAPTPGAPGLYHIAFKIGTNLEELEAARRHLEACGLPVFGDWQSGGSHSISTRDPDGHEIELYITRRAAPPSPRRVARAKPALRALRTEARAPASGGRHRSARGPGREKP